MGRFSQDTFQRPQGAAIQEAQAFVNDDELSSGRHSVIQEEEQKPIQHTYNFLDDQTEGVACLQEVCVKLDPHAVTGVLDEKEFVPPTHTYSFLDDATEGVDLDPIELIQANENKK